MTADPWTMQPFRRCADRFTPVFCDHRCNGRSGGPTSLGTIHSETTGAARLDDAGLEQAVAQ